MARTDIIHGDRRSDRRYAFELEMRFSFTERRTTHAGRGYTVDLSRGGIRFCTDTPPPAGSLVEMHLAWPFLLQNVIPLELQLWGSVLRSDADGTVVRITKYEFRTCGARAFHQPEEGASIFSFVA